MTTPLISVVSPVYKAEKIVPELVKRIIESITEITDNYEIILVEDASPDGSWAKIEEECKRNSKVKGIKFSRNYGQHYAITAGLQYAKGDYIVVLDCDLQENPKYIKDLYEATQSGVDIVFTYKEKRSQSVFKKITAALFYKLYNNLLDNRGNKIHEDIGTLSMINRKVADAFLSYKEFNRDYTYILQSLGYKTAYKKIQHDKRYEGKSSYTFSKLFKHAIASITSYSDKLLRLSISFGFVFFLISIIWAIYTLYMHFTSNVPMGYTSMFIFELLGTGLILMSLGITGIYIGKIFEQVKERPLYTIDTKVNL